MIPTIRPPQIRFRKATLPNGLDVIVRRDPRLPIAAMNLWYHVGSKDERHGQRGYAHLFEHLMFEGSEHYPGDFFRRLQPLGARVNGSTSPDRTNYFVDLPTAHLELALALESDRMGHLLPALTDATLATQKGVVTNEYRQNYANRPYGQVPRLLAEALYPPDHPYRWPTIGAMEDVDAASRADVEAFFRRFYVPANASLCLVGDLDEEEVLALADRYFGPIPGGALALRPTVPAVEAVASRSIRLDDRVELDRLYLTWHSVAQFEPEDAPLSLASDVLATGRSSRLYRLLVLEEEIAQDVSVYQSGRELAGTFGVVVTLRPGRSWERARDLVDQTIADLANQVDPGELERARTGRIGRLIYALDAIGGFGGVADRLNAFNVYRGDPSLLSGEFDRYASVTADDLTASVRRFLVATDGTTRPRVELLVSGGNAEEGRAERKSLDRTIAPPAGEPVAFRAPIAERRVLRCGAELWAVPRRDLPVVTATLAVPGGAGSHDRDRGGLASLTAAMLDEGTASRSATDLAREAESMATSLWASAGWAGSYVGLRCLRPHLDASLDLAVDILRNPTFPEPEWRRVRGQTLAALRSRRDRAESLAARALLGALYGADHPYQVSIDGTIGTVEALDLGALRAFHAGHYRPQGSAWIVAGDIDPDELAERLDDRLEGWSGSTAVATEPAPPEPSPRRRILLVDRPGAPQAVLRVGHVGIGRLDDDYLDLLVLNQILGGQFISRLNETIRERKGLTYGIRSSVDARRGAGPFAVASSIQSDRLAEALADVVAEIEALRGDRPPTLAELDDARRGLLEGQARHFETPSDLVSRFAGLFLHGLPPDHHATFPERLAAVELDRLAAVASRRLRPESLVAVIVADAEEVAGPLERLGWAEVERIELPDLD